MKKHNPSVQYTIADERVFITSGSLIL